jgi:mRNA interferase MazF
MVMVAPLTRTDRDMPTQVRIAPPQGGLSANSYIMCEQVKAVSVMRFRGKRGSVTPETLQMIERIIPWLIERPGASRP